MTVNVQKVPHGIRLTKDYCVTGQQYKVFTYWLFQKYFEKVDAIYEFGCGSGINIAILAQMFPEKKIVGLDWAAASKKILDKLAKAKTGRIELRGRNITKDFVYVEDVGDAFVRALTSDYVGEINIGSGKQTTLEYVARHIAKALGAELTFSSVDPSGPTHMQYDPTRALKILGWKATTPIERGLDKTIAASK